MPKRYFINKFSDFQAGSDILQSINRSEFRKKTLKIKDLCISKFAKTHANCDGGLYVGLGGLAYALWYASTKHAFDSERIQLLKDAKHLLDFHVEFAEQPKHHEHNDQAAFILGRGGLYVAGALLYSSLDESAKAESFVQRYVDGARIVLQPNYLPCGGDELFVGRAGYLCGLLNLRLKLGHAVIDDNTVMQIIRVIYESGRHYSKRHRSPSPLMYSYYDTEYLGAAHGLCSILQMILSFPDVLRSCSDVEDAVRGSVDWMLSVQQPNGNTASSADELSSGRSRSETDELVHWCHGAPGNVYMFIRAYLYWRDEKYLHAAVKCGDVVWEKGLLKKGPGTCHGISGNAYVFLNLYRLTNDQRHLHRALRFVEFMDSEEFANGARTPDTPYSLFEGWAGAMCLYADLTEDLNRCEFPLFPVFF